jgi:hypothetical protein
MNRSTPSPNDQSLKCIDSGRREGCENEFTFTEGESKFFAEKGFSPPKRCKPCRNAKKAEKGDAPPPASTPVPGWDAPPLDDSSGRRRKKGRGGGRRDDDDGY